MGQLTPEAKKILESFKGAVEELKKRPPNPEQWERESKIFKEIIEKNRQMDMHTRMSVEQFQKPFTI